MKNRVKISLIVGGIILILINSQTSILVQGIHDNGVEEKIQFEYTLSDSIIITHNDNFTDYGLLGTGTSEDPYLIKNFNITTSNEASISVSDTTDYFVITNCYVESEFYGIRISDVADGTATIINNICKYNQRGIRLYHCRYTEVINNTCTYNYIAISVETYGVTITDNTCSFNQVGIHTVYGGHSVTNNTCNYNEYAGITLTLSDSSSVIRNTCSHNGIYGIHSWYSPSVTIINNTFFNNGLSIEESAIEDYLTYTIENNLINEKLIGWFVNIDNLIFSNQLYGQLIFINCSEIVVSNQNLSSTSVGLYLDRCENITISNNNINLNSYKGVIVDSSSEIKFEKNMCSDNYEEGIYLTSSSEVTAIENICYNNTSGIRLDYSSKASIVNNSCNSNMYSGIFLLESSYSTLTKNNCKNNTIGIHFVDTDSSLITYNILQDNELYGIYLFSDSDNNLIHHNSFIDNYIGGTSQAGDLGDNNIWYDVETKEGNFWSDWDCNDPYIIDSHSEDPYPLNENLEKISWDFLLSIPSLIYLILISRRTKKK